MLPCLRLNNQLNNQKEKNADSDINQKLHWLETEMDAKILHIQEKHAKVSRMKLDG